MGCWNETCGLTQLPICGGDRAVWLPVAPVRLRDDAENGIYYNPDSLFKPAGLCLRGTYNDYGTIEKVDKTPAAKMTLEYFQHGLKMGTFQNLTPEHDRHGACLPKGGTLDEVLHLVERGYMKYGNTGAIAQVMFHERPFNLLINEVRSRFSYKQKKSIGKAVEQQVLKELHRKKEKNKTIEKWALRSDFLSRFYEDHVESGFYFMECFRKEKREDLVPAMTELYFLQMALQLMRKLLIPQMGKGSQCGEIYLHTLLAGSVKKHYDRMMKEWKKENVEDDSFEPFRETPFDLW